MYGKTEIFTATTITASNEVWRVKILGPTVHVWDRNKATEVPLLTIGTIPAARLLVEALEAGIAEAAKDRGNA